jgi:hypothetical protein
MNRLFSVDRAQHSSLGFLGDPLQERSPGASSAPNSLRQSYPGPAAILGNELDAGLLVRQTAKSAASFFAV